MNMSQQGKGLKQRYYRNFNTLSLCRPVFLSRNIQTQQDAARKKGSNNDIIGTLTL